MKYLQLFFLTLILLCCLSGTPVNKDHVIVIRNVNVIPMDQERILANHSVVIRNGYIEQVVPAARAAYPADAEVIDGTGKYLVPGLMDMHAHFFYEQGDNRNTCEAELSMMLASGLTTARIQCGDSVYLYARKMVREKQWEGPELFVSSPQFVGKWPWPGKVFAEICTTPEEAEAAVRKCKREGYDEIKITFMVKKEVYDAIIRTAKEEQIKVTGHVGPLVKLPAALKAGEQIEHMDEFIDMLLPDTSYNHGQSVSDMNIWRKAAWETVDHLDESKMPALVKRVKNAGIYVTPTNFFFFSSFGDSMSETQIRDRADFRFIPPVIMQDRWKVRAHYWKNAPSPERRKKYIHLRQKMTHDLWRAGVKLMAGSDSPEWFLVQGFSIHDELETFVSAGLSPYAALQTATVNPAAYLGIAQRKGTIEKGKAGDLVLLDANPLEQIGHTRKINAVIRNGKVYNRAQLDRMLQQAQTTLQGN